MNEIYKSDTLTIHDDREPITIEEAFNLLWNGKSIIANDLPDFSQEDESSVYGSEFIYFITDIIQPDILQKQSRDKSEKDVKDFLRYYELYK